MEQTHHFGNATFNTLIWVDNARLFTRLKSIDVEFLSAGAFAWIFSDKLGNEVKSVPYPNEQGGWTSIHLPSLGLFGDFKVGFRNASSGPKKIKQGDVTFDDLT